MNVQDVIVAAGFEPAYFTNNAEFKGWTWGSAVLAGSVTEQLASSADRVEKFSVWARLFPPLEDELEGLSDLAIALDPTQRSLALVLWASDKYQIVQTGILGPIDERIDDTLDTLSKLISGLANQDIITETLIAGVVGATVLSVAGISLYTWVKE